MTQRQPHTTPRPGEMTMKAFALAQMQAHGITRSAVAMNFARGKYPNVKVRRVNPRVVFCQVNGSE